MIDAAVAQLFWEDTDSIDRNYSQKSEELSQETL